MTTAPTTAAQSAARFQPESLRGYYLAVFTTLVGQAP
jgi:hypothetical protein